MPGSSVKKKLGQLYWQHLKEIFQWLQLVVAQQYGRTEHLPFRGLLPDELGSHYYILSKETSKAVRRRFLEDQASGNHFWSDIFRGYGLDLGCGDDPLPYINCKPFDKKDGDAQLLSRYIAGAYDYIHASQLLEHLRDPIGALRDWYKLLKKNGHVIITVPDWCLYEGMRWPSRYNPDHRSTWSLWLKGSPAPIHIYVPDFVNLINDKYNCLRSELIDTNYSYKTGTNKDQTQIEELAVEAFLEIVLVKR